MDNIVAVKTEFFSDVNSFTGMEGDRMEVGNQKQSIHVEVLVKSQRWVSFVVQTLWSPDSTQIDALIY